MQDVLHICILLALYSLCVPSCLCVRGSIKTTKEIQHKELKDFSRSRIHYQIAKLANYQLCSAHPIHSRFRAPFRSAFL
jgi:hypothetical protein